MDWNLILQTGGLGVAAYAIYALLEINRSKDKIIGNHIDHSTEALNKLSIALEKLAGKLDKLDKKK